MTIKAGDHVAIYGGHTHKQIATGTVDYVTKNFAVIDAPALYVRTVRYRINPDRPLCGHRVTGGLCEYLNDFIRI